jgi:hypothetical protein
MCWDWKSDAPVGEIADRVNDLLSIGARQIGSTSPRAATRTC